jgi:alkylation response protein AidB-like acyl-CoA dehydrogenase
MIGPVPDWAQELVLEAIRADEDIEVAVALSERFGRPLALPGQGRTAERWSVLAAVAEVNLTVARVLEAHSDALAILAEAGTDAPRGSWGVFAAETSSHHVEARREDGRTTLHGVKPWCSIAQHLDAALVTAHVDENRQLFRVNLRDPSVQAASAGPWIARGLRTLTSAPVSFAGTSAEPVGSPGWYLVRPGFAWGGMGVAACWYGGAVGLYTTLRRMSASRRGELAGLHVGAVDVQLHASACTLADAARRIDEGAAHGSDAEILALRVRAVVAEAVERTIVRVGHALGPAPLAFDEDHARRVADLQLYVRQHHAESDLATLGQELLAGQGQSA